MNQEHRDSVNLIVKHVDESIQTAEAENESVVGVILINENKDDMLTIAATPQGVLYGQYVFCGVPIVGKATRSSRELAEDLITYIENFYALNAAVESDATLDAKTEHELGVEMAMVIHEQMEDF